MVTIEVRRGKHHHPIPDGLEDSIRVLLERSGRSGHFSVRFGAKITGTAHTRGVRLKGHGRMHLCLAVQPGGNDTRHMVYVPVQDGEPLDTFYRDIESLLDAEERAATTEVRTTSADRASPQTCSVDEETKEVEVIDTDDTAPAEPAKSFKGFVKDEENIFLVLDALYEMDPECGWLSWNRCMEIITELFNGRVSPHVFGKILGGISNRNFLEVRKEEEARESGKRLRIRRSFRITEKGLLLIRKHSPSVKTPPVEKAAPAAENVSDIFAHAIRRLEERARPARDALERVRHAEEDLEDVKRLLEVVSTAHKEALEAYDALDAEAKSALEKIQEIEKLLK